MVRSAIQAVRQVSDLSRLFTALGYTADSLPYDEHESVVARYRSYKIIAATAEHCRDRARALALKLAKRSERALAVAISPPHELACAAPRFDTSGTTKVFVLSLNHPSAEAIDQLRQLQPKKTQSALEHSLRIVQVLSCEAVSERFFKRFKSVHDVMAESLGDCGTRADRRMVALLTLTRILFLYFVQQKGWLDNNASYLRELLDDALSERREFHHSVLDPLFFGTLNQKRNQRPERRCGRLGEIPYLNGGLFEPHPAEQSLGKFHFTNQVWRCAFDDLFERFRFCVREADEVDAIAPDMLGRVFERLMEDEQRHLSGTFYTPETLVRQIVDAAIETALTTPLGSRARRLVRLTWRRDDDPAKARAALKRIRILDPAVGSGAFLLSALDALSQMQISLMKRSSAQRASEIKKTILRDNLFGVDINPAAVRLAELRLWLAVVADDPTTDILHVAPLPNLDGVVRQGDTLLDPVGAARLLTPDATRSSIAIAESIRTARRALFASQGEARRSGLRTLRRLEFGHAVRMLDAATSQAERAADELIAVTKNRDLFGHYVRLSQSQQDRLTTLRNSLQRLASARAELRSGVLPFFSFEVHTPDVMARGGFDIVVGNPPWVRAERLPMVRRKTLQQRFKWWRSGGSGKGYTHLPDLSIAFLERCVELTARGGAVGLLLPSKVLSAGYGEVARRHVVKEQTIAYVHRVPERETSQFHATTYPVALVLRNAPPHRDHHVTIGFNHRQTLRQNELDVAGPWILCSADERAAVRDLEASGVALRDIAPPMLGVKTGADPIFVGTVAAVRADVAVVEFSSETRYIERGLLRPAVRGRDVNAYAVTPRRVILWCYDHSGHVLAHLPRRAAEHIQRNAAVLRERADYTKGPLWSLFRTRCVQGQHHVVWRDIDRRPRAVVLDQSEHADAIPLNTCYVAHAPDRETAHAIAAVFNSTWTAALVRMRGDEARGGFRRINMRTVATVPIPASKTMRKALAALSLNAHREKHVDHQAVDEAVADALDLPTRHRQTLRSLVRNPQ